ncbi:MAG: FAD:protein FMN transferase [Bacteroidales bacterium]|nr:FAD:protein FMN transferase [Bacteroidales bacterium]
MKKSVLILLSVLGLFLSCQRQDRYIVLGGYAQGGTYSVKMNLRGVRVRPQVIQTAVDSLLREIDFTVSGYNKASLLSRLNAGETITPNEMLCRLYDLSYGFFRRSEGALDVACGPLFDIWGFGFTADSLPGPERIAEAAARSGMGRLKPTMEEALAADGTLRAADLLLDGTGDPPVLNFNAIAQGFSCDYVAEYLCGLGVRDMLVDIGEIYCAGRNPQGKSWAIGIDRPIDGNNTPGADMEGVWHSSGDAGQGVVTSGNYRKFYVRDGRKYSHTIDPRSGVPVAHNLLSATIVAEDATTADVVATWCMVLGFKDAALLLQDPALEGCLIYDTEDGMRSWTTPGFGLTSR